MNCKSLAPTDINKVIKKLEEVSSNSLGRLHPQISTSSVDDRDSGLSSQSVSTSSLDHRLDNFSPMEKISEVPSCDGRGKRPKLIREPGFEDPQSPTISVEEAVSDTESKLAGKSPLPGPCHHLSISLPPRKGSSASNTSEEYETPPTSRKISFTSSSSSNSPQDVRINVQINLPNSNGEMVVNSSAKLYRNLKQLQVNIYFTPNSSKHSPALMNCSSHSSTPNSPTPKEKMLNFPSKSLDTPHSPCTVKRCDKTNRQSRNNLIARIMRRNMVEFVDSTDIDSLCPHLYAKELLSHNDMEELQGIKSARGKKNFFYMLLLDSKGVSAYQKLLECLEDETQHCGHRDLVKIVEDGLKKKGLE